MTRLRRSDLNSGRFWRRFASSAFSLIGFVAVLAGLYDVLFPDTAGKIGKPAVAGIILTATVYGFLRAWPRAVSAKYSSPNTKISIVPGDLLQDDAHLVIGMSDTFDTKPPIIAPASLQAQFLAEVLGGDAARFDQGIEQSLRAEGVASIGTIQKSGKTDRYAIGTVATLEEGTRRFFCVAYSELNPANEARASIDGVTESLSSLWRAVCRHANGEPVAMPVIGMGQSRLSNVLSPSDAITLQVLSFWLASREEPRCSELRIVVLPGDYDALDRGALQDFLNGLGR